MPHRLSVFVLVVGISFLHLSVTWHDAQCGVDTVADSTRAVSARHDTGGVSFRAHPLSDCRVFFLTNAGGYLKLSASSSNPPSGTQSNLRAIWDWGVMVNITPRDAIGGSWFVCWDEDDVTTGPVVHYRRWFGPRRSLDLAVGTPVTGGEGELQTGSVLGLIKYNIVDWFGVAVRPEYVRYGAAGSWARVFVGMEFGWFPGVGLTVVGGAVSAAAIAFGEGLE
jgi:hypothetical protein